MRERKARQTVALVAALAGMVGFVLAPKLADAHRARQHTEIHQGRGGGAANVTGGRVHTQIRGAPGGGAANVTGGKLHTVNRGGLIDVSGSIVEAATTMGVLGNGTGDGTAQAVCSDDGILSGVSATGTGDIEVRGAEGLLWKADVDGTTETMFGGAEVPFRSNLQVIANNADWIVYGFRFEGASAQQAEELQTARTPTGG